MLILPKRKHQNSRRAADSRSCPAHRAWVRGHCCSVPGCEARDIECAHVRTGTDGGAGLKPSDRYAISLWRAHHAEQHRVGEQGFDRRYKIDMHALAEHFASRSPFRQRL